MSQIIKKNILFVNHSSEITGGANDEFIRLLKYFSEFKDEYNIYGLFPEGPNAVNYSIFCKEWKTYPTYFFPVMSGNIIHYIGYIKNYFIQKKITKEFLKNIQFDICILNVVVMLWLTILLKNNNSKCLIFIREKIEPNIIRKIYYKIINKYGDYFVAVSDSLKSDFKDSTKNENIITLYSSIEKDLHYKEYYSDFKKKLKDLKISDLVFGNQLKFINVAAIEDRKNQILILESLNILKERGCQLPIFFFIGGDLEGKYAVKLKKFILLKNLSSNCFFLGRADKNFLYNLLSFMDCMVIASKSEGLPLVMVESLRFKVPLITTNVGGIKDIIRNGYNGITFGLDKNELANVISDVLDNKNLRIEISESGFETYNEKFNLERNLNNIKDIVDNLITN